MLNIIVIICISGGFFFFFSGTIGILRFPDFYSRLHPAGKLDPAGLLLMMAGMALYTMRDFTLSSTLTGLKIILIIFFVFLTSPTATHAIIDAGFIAGLRPWTKDTEQHEAQGQRIETGEQDL